MSARREELYERLIDTRSLPEGPARVAATEAALADIEAAGERGLLPFAYHTLIWAYHRGAELEKSLAPFEAELLLYDTEPELFGENEIHRLLWSFKWMTAGLWKLPSASREHIEATIADMERRYLAAGQGLSAVTDIRLYYAIHRGDWAAAETLYQRAIAVPRDSLSDCEACTANERGYYHSLRGDDAAALRMLDTVIDDGLSCATEPHASLGTALMPYTREGRIDEARAAHLRGYRMIRGRLAFQTTLGEHLEFLARTGNESRGLAVLAENEFLLTEQDHPLARLNYLSSVGLLLRRIAETSGPDTPVAGPDGPGTAAEVADWARTTALELAARFDERNGTPAQTVQALAVLDAEPVLADLRLALGTGDPRPLDAPVAETALAEALPGLDAHPAAAEPIGVTAELIGAEGLGLAALVERAEELAAIGHPATGPLWHRVAERAGPGADPRILAKADDGIGRTLSSTDPFGSRERLRSAVERWLGTGDEREIAVARSRAAVAAALTGDHDAAIDESDSAGEALARIGSPAERLHHLYRRAYVRLASAADATGRAEAAALFRAHIAEATRLGAPADATQSRIILLDHLDDPSEPAAAAVVWEECAQVALTAGREWWLPHIAVRLAQSGLAAGWFPDRSEAVFAALADAIRYGDSWGELRPAAYAMYLRGELLAELEEHETARDAAFEAVIRAEDAGMAALATEARVLLGTVHHELERDEEAVAYLEAALAALSGSDPHLLFRVRYRLGVSLHRIGEVHDAAVHLTAASDIAEKAGVPASAAHAANLAGVALEQADPSAAAAAFLRAATLFGEAGEGQGEVRMYRAQAASLAESGRFDDALDALERAGVAAEALAPADEVDPRWERAEVDDQSARVLAMAGRGVEAVHRALSAEQRHDEAGAPADAAHAAALAAQVTLELLDDAQAAEPVARRALKHAEASDDETAHTSAVLALAAVLDGQGRGAEASTLRATVGVDDPD
ncbi:MAG: hypothetical protein JWO79_1259 [Actinomycetia bacterium]|nr:hypothetical protein [Actinomycetes bacterium]